MTADASDPPLVWVPFDPEDLPDRPETLRYERFEPGMEWPASGSQVRFYVPAYERAAEAARLVDRMPALEVVQTLSAGVDHVRRLVPDGVRLCNGRGIHDASTAELAVTLALAAQRGLPDFVRGMAAGEWRQDWRPSLADRRVLIVGYGQIGAAIEARLEHFEVEITRVARSRREDPPVHPVGDLPKLLPDADVVILVMPGTAETEGLLDARMLAAMADGALLVNVSRGSVVDQRALRAELEAGRLRAAIDVMTPEPLPPEDPLWRAPNLLVTPHVGGMTDAMWPRARRLLSEQLHRYAAGEPLANVMDGDY